MTRFVPCCLFVVAVVLVGGVSTSAQATTCKYATAKVHLDSGVPALNITGLKAEIDALGDAYNRWLKGGGKKQTKAVFGFTPAPGRKISHVIRFKRVVAITYLCEFDQTNTASRRPVTLEVRMDAGARYTVQAEDTYVRNFMRDYDRWVRGGKQVKFNWGFKLQTGKKYKKPGILVSYERIAAIQKIGGFVPKPGRRGERCPPSPKGPGY